MRIRYFAAAAAAASVDELSIPEKCSGTILEIAASLPPDAHTNLKQILQVCSFLVDGSYRASNTELKDLVNAAVIDVLPPFAGG